jgi:hypothetical protein
MNSRRLQLIFLVLVAVLVIGQGLVGSPQGPTIQQVWEQMTR